MTKATGPCGRCGKPGPHDASIGDTPYCHDGEIGDGPTCYMLAMLDDMVPEVPSVPIEVPKRPLYPEMPLYPRSPSIPTSPCYPHVPPERWYPPILAVCWAVLYLVVYGAMAVGLIALLVSHIRG